MSDTLRVAVFCGFGETPKRSSEMLFAYQLLAIFEHGKLSKRELKDSIYASSRLRSADFGHGRPLFNKFSLFSVPPRDGVLPEIKNALSGDTFAYSLVIIPHRTCKCGKCTSFKKCKCAKCACNSTRTTPFVPMEFALAEGMGKAPIAFVEKSVAHDEIPLIAFGAKVHAYHRGELTDRTKWESIRKELLNLERGALRHSSFHIGLPEEDITDFYKRLCKYILTAKEVTIFNHSHLPLGSTFDPNDTGRRGGRRRGHHGIQWRDRYFEFEEALLAQNHSRLSRTFNRALDQSEKKLLDLMRKRIETWQSRRNGAFRLKRVLSIPDALDFASWQEGLTESVRERYISIFQHIARLEKRHQAKRGRHTTRYQLCAFPTRTLHSLPTTISIIDDYDTQTGIWGFLRNPDEASGEDAFIVTHNSSTASVFRKHVSAFFSGDNRRPDEPLEILIAENEWVAEKITRACYRVCKLINNVPLVKLIAKDLHRDFHRPGRGFKIWLDEISRMTPKKLSAAIIVNSE